MQNDYQIEALARDALDAVYFLEHEYNADTLDHARSVIKVLERHTPQASELLQKELKFVIKHCHDKLEELCKRNLR